MMNPLRFTFTFIFLVTTGNFIMCFSFIVAVPAKTNICQSTACKKIATSILQKMNQSVHPCDDFYEFVCGDFSRNGVLSPTRSRNDLIIQLTDTVQKKLKNHIENQITKKDPEAFHKLLRYYTNCMDEETIEKTSKTLFLTNLKNFGGWPVLIGKSYNDSTFDWKVIMKKINNIGYSRNYILSVHIAIDLQNNKKNRLYLLQTAFAISEEYLSQGLENNVVKAYFKYMVDMAEIFGADREQAKLELQESLNFEIELAKVYLLEDESRIVEEQYNPMKISELQRRYPYISWLQYLNDQLKQFYRLTEDEVVIVTVPSFFKNLGDLLARTPKRILANYLMWRVVFESANQLDQKVRDAQLEFSAALTGQRNQIPRWQTCIYYASNHLSLATSSLYARRNFNKASKDGVTDMIRRLQQSFKNILLEVDWMDETTRRSALQKLDRMIPLVGYLDESLDDEKINDYYKNFQICPKSYLTTVLRLKRLANDKELERFSKPVPRVDWTYPYYASDVVNAFYNPNENIIQFPAGILQGDLYNEEHPKYVNYASIGSIIGHEMTHGFDDQGSQFDDIGNMVDWWKNETKEEYLRRALCIIDQYNNYTDPQVHLDINGFVTQGENIADNGGLKEAYLAYVAFLAENGEESRLPGFEKFTAKQHFWISYGNILCTRYRDEYLADLITTDSHSPSRFRLIGTVMNSPYFAKDFNCPAGRPMNPVEKCSVW